MAEYSCQIFPECSWQWKCRQRVLFCITFKNVIKALCIQNSSHRQDWGLIAWCSLTPVSSVSMSGESQAPARAMMITRTRKQGFSLDSLESVPPPSFVACPVVMPPSWQLSFWNMREPLWFPILQWCFAEQRPALYHSAATKVGRQDKTLSSLHTRKIEKDFPGAGCVRAFDAQVWARFWTPSG